MLMITISVHKGGRGFGETRVFRGTEAEFSRYAAKVEAETGFTKWNRQSTVDITPRPC